LKRVAVLYDDALCLILNKPAGLAVQGGAGVGVSLDRMLEAAYSPRPLLVHRLDRDTSGVILAAKTPEAAARLSRLLGDSRAGKNAVIKQYLAICAGSLSPQESVIRHDLAIKGRVKKSETRCRTLKTFEAGGQCFSLVELRLVTGRMHQIRRHLAMSGHPVLGDDKYGDFTLNKTLRKTMQVRHLLLHAHRLIIAPQEDGFSLDITAPPPDYFEEFLKGCGSIFNSELFQKQ
jgi:23S rRNA pseudouridine955/2504/2580 synthase